MVRLPRVVIPGVPHHVSRRGNGRERASFADRRAGADFEDLRGFMGRKGGEPPRPGDEVAQG